MILTELKGTDLPPWEPVSRKGRVHALLPPACRILENSSLRDGDKLLSLPREGFCLDAEFPSVSMGYDLEIIWVSSRFCTEGQGRRGATGGHGFLELGQP